MPDKKTKKHLSACIIGKPNAGKSTLFNNIIGQDISIVTPKVQTTRNIITGILTLNQVQILLLDTPGIFTPKRTLERAMVRFAWASLNSADVIILIIDQSKKIDPTMEEIINRISDIGKEIIVLLNKSDLKTNNQEPNKSLVKKSIPDAKIFHISALNGDGIKEFLKNLQGRAQGDGWLYSEEEVTTMPSSFLANEVTREELFLQLSQELPYKLTVECEKWIEKPDGSIEIRQIILVSKPGHKMIILGKNGTQIKEVGTKARKKIQKLLERKIHLFLFVKIHKNWEEQEQFHHPTSIKYHDKV